MKKRMFILQILLCLLISACQFASSTPETKEASPEGLIEAGTPFPIVTTTDTTSIQDMGWLSGGSFDQFVDDSFELLLLRDPEGVTIEGLSERFGMQDNQLTNLSDAYIHETQTLQRAIYDLLLSYDRTTLTPAQQVTYDTYAWYLDDLIRAQDYMYNDYPVNQMYVLGQQYLTLNLFTEYQPLDNREDAQNYITRLSQVKTKFDQLIESLNIRRQVGILPPRFVYELSMGDVQGIANTPADNHPFYLTFRDKVNALSGLGEAEKEALLTEAINAVEDSVIPAYQALAATLRELMKDASQQDGIWQFDNGSQYYAYALRHFTSTELSAEQIHQLGLAELDRIQAEMRQAFTALGYPTENSLATNYNQLARDSGLLQGEAILRFYETLITTASQRLNPAFDVFPKATVEMGRIPSGAAFYVSAALDGSRPGVFYAPVGGQQPAYNKATVAYHEAVPGHHFQISLQREMDLPLFRNVMIFNAYTEGWALYAERLAWEMGWYEYDPYGNLGRLQYEAHRAARLVVDTGIHAKKWTFDQAVDYMVENTGLERSFLQSEVARYIVWPGQAASYYMGYLKLLELREMVQSQLGSDFDLAEFHNLVLGTGSVPLDVLEEVVGEWLSGLKD